MRTVETIHLTLASLYLWRDFWRWELLGDPSTQSASTRKRRLHSKAVAIVEHDRALLGRLQ